MYTYIYIYINTHNPRSPWTSDELGPKTFEAHQLWWCFAWWRWHRRPRDHCGDARWAWWSWTPDSVRNHGKIGEKSWGNLGYPMEIPLYGKIVWENAGKSTRHGRKQWIFQPLLMTPEATWSNYNRMSFVYPSIHIDHLRADMEDHRTDLWLWYTLW